MNEKVKPIKNKYEVGEVLIHPVFIDNCIFACMSKTSPVSDIQRVTYEAKDAEGNPETVPLSRLAYFFSDTGEWIREEELFRTQEEAEKYVYWRSRAAIKNIENALSRIQYKGELE